MHRTIKQLACGQSVSEGSAVPRDTASTTQGDSEQPQMVIASCLEDIFLKRIFRSRQGVEEPV